MKIRRQILLLTNIQKNTYININIFQSLQLKQRENLIQIKVTKDYYLKENIIDHKVNNLQVSQILLVAVLLKSVYNLFTLVTVYLVKRK